MSIKEEFQKQRAYLFTLFFQDIVFPDINLNKF